MAGAANIVAPTHAAARRPPVVVVNMSGVRRIIPLT
jgi:hypothetical protein